LGIVHAIGSSGPREQGTAVTLSSGLMRRPEQAADM
jgi:hypothetical protein